LECLYLYHSIELYLNDIITIFDGQTKAPDKLVSQSVFNIIPEIKKEDLVEANLQQSNIQPNMLAQNVIKSCLEILLRNFSTNNQQSIRDDQACLLTFLQ